MKPIISLRRSQRAFTLLELLAAIAVMAIAFGWAFPSLQTMIRNNQVAAENVELIALLHFTKSEAIRRNTDVPIVLTALDDGWNAIVEDPAEEADVEGCVPGQLRCASYEQASLTLDLPGDSSTLVFNNRGYISNPDDPLVFANGVIYLQHGLCSGSKQRRRIEITPTGQIRSCELACNDVETECI